MSRGIEISEIQVLALRTYGYSIVNYKYYLKRPVLGCENPSGRCVG